MRSRKFTVAYSMGLTGAKAAWAARIYRGHRAFPENLEKEAEAAGIRW